MEVFGLTIARTKTLELQTKQQSLSSLAGWRTWGSWIRGFIHETSAGGWQRNEEVSVETALAHPTVYACISLIQRDLGKLRPLLGTFEDRVFTELTNPAYSPVLRKPNHFQTWQQFAEAWINSKLIFGNTYVIKRRDHRGVVTALYVIDPSRVTTLVAPDGSVFYELSSDDLVSIRENVQVPAREIIHDRMPALFHQMLGVSPLYAAANIIAQGLNIQNTSNTFFANGAQPGGILMSDLPITQEQAERIGAKWQEQFGGNNSGKVAVIGGGLKYESVAPTKAVDTQLVEQVNWIDERICSCFGMPPHKVGIGDQPNYTNIEALNQQYWSECLQDKAEAMQTLLQEGLNTSPYVIRLDTTDLLKMDTATMVTAASEGIRAGFLAPNEARRIFFNLPPVKGGETPYMQHQDYSLGALAERDALAPAPSSAGARPPSEPEPKQLPVTTNRAEAVLLYQKALRA